MASLWPLAFVCHRSHGIDRFVEDFVALKRPAPDLIAWSEVPKGLLGTILLESD